MSVTNVERLESRQLLSATNPLALSALDGSNGFRIDGIGVRDFSGSSVSSAGDVNGDGFDDLIIGAFGSDVGGTDSGESYVVFGKSGGFSSALDLALLDGQNGFRLNGLPTRCAVGSSVSSAGDVNGDGFDDLLIGAMGGNAADGYAGICFVVFGKSSDFSSVLNLSLLDGSDGFRLNGIDALDAAGSSVSSAGDLNGDGFDDLIIGAPEADAGGSASGESYVVFGKASDFAAAFELSTLDGSNGFRLNGININDRSGSSVDSAGDVNGDGFDDLIIGASAGDAGGVLSGESYLVFGKSGEFASVLELSSLDGNNGFRLDGIDALDGSGRSVSSAGDVNGDGFDDLIVGASGAGPGGISSGESYIIFGKSGSFGSTFDLSSLDGSNGFRLDGIDDIDQSGFSVSSAGDVNCDGYDDVIVGAYRADAGGDASGESYVVFGKAGAFPAAVGLSTLDGTNGFRLDGTDADDLSGASVSSAGDINGDGFDDLIIGAYQADAGATDSGESYVVFGGNFTGGAETKVGDASPNTLDAVNGAAKDILVGGGANDFLISDGGPDVLQGGEGNDILAVPNADFSSKRRLLGGNGMADRLRLDGSSITLDLTSIRDNRIVEIEEIDITDSGANTLTLNAAEVLNISSHSNTLIVRRDINDTVNKGTGWNQQPNETLGSSVFAVFIQGAATLKVQKSAVPVILGPPAVTPYQRPTFIWTPVSGANRYEWRLTRQGDSGSAHGWGGTATAWYPTTDFQIGTWYLRVRAGSSVTDESSEWTPQHTFRINTAATFGAVPRYQATSKPFVRWNSLLGAIGYDLWIDNLSTGQEQIVRDMNVAGTAWTSSAELPMGIYRAWVRAIDDTSGTAAAWSKSVDFYVLPPVTVTPAITSTFDRTPTLTWTALPGAIAYDVTLRNANTGAIISSPKNISGTSYTQPTDLPAGPYLWQVVAVMSGEYRSQSATTQQLYIGGRPTLLTPAASTSDTTPTFTWTPVGDAATYDLFVTRTDVAVGGIINLTNLTASNYTPPAPLPVGTYRAWVRAVSTTGEFSPWSIQVNFAITAAIEVPELLPGIEFASIEMARLLPSHRPMPVIEERPAADVDALMAEFATAASTSLANLSSPTG